MSLIYTPKAENGRRNIARRSRLLLFLSALWNFFRLLVVLSLGIMGLASQPANAQKAGDWHPDLDAYDMGQAQVASAAKPKRTIAAAPKPKRQVVFVSRTVSPKPLAAYRGTALESACGNNSLDDLTDFFNPFRMPSARLRNPAGHDCRQAPRSSSGKGREAPAAGADSAERDRFSHGAWDGSDCNLADEMNHTAEIEENQGAESRGSASSLGSFARQLVTSPFPIVDSNLF